MEKLEGLNLKPEALPVVRPLLHGNIWNGGSQEGLGIREMCQGSATQGPWEDLPSSDRCIPSRVSRTPGRPSCEPHLRTECGLREGGPLTHSPMPDPKGEARLGERAWVWAPLCLCFSLGLTVCLGPVLPKHLSISLSLSLSLCGFVSQSLSVPLRLCLPVTAPGSAQPPGLKEYPGSGASKCLALLV